jgi:hypothetical protein
LTWRTGIGLAPGLAGCGFIFQKNNWTSQVADRIISGCPFHEFSRPSARRRHFRPPQSAVARSADFGHGGPRFLKIEIPSLFAAKSLILNGGAVEKLGKRLENPWKKLGKSLEIFGNIRKYSEILG